MVNTTETQAREDRQGAHTAEDQDRSDHPRNDNIRLVLEALSSTMRGRPTSSSSSSSTMGIGMDMATVTTTTATAMIKAMADNTMTWLTGEERLRIRAILRRTTMNLGPMDPGEEGERSPAEEGVQ